MRTHEKEKQIYLNQREEMRNKRLHCVLVLIFSGMIFGDYAKKKTGVTIMLLFALSGAFLFLLVEYRKNRKTLRRLAFVDEVTGGINKMEFAIRYQTLCRKETAHQYAIVLMDAVDFKMINEMFGTEYGDRMLRYFYEVIQSCLKEEENEFAVRMEMDHFFLCLKEDSPQTIQQRMESVEEKINAFRDIMLLKHKIAFRYGVSFIEDNKTELTAIQDQARVALKSCRGDQAGRFLVYNFAVAQRLHQERELNYLFDESIARGDFQVYMQPKVSIKKRMIEGAEALVRWNCPGRGILQPLEFIPILERNGKIRNLEHYVFEMVCCWLKKQKGESKNVFPISVNLSRSHFEDDDFLDAYIEIAKKYGVEPSLIEFEITETIFMDESHIQKIKAGIQKMHACGFCCALDDFGAGYSSLILLKEAEIDVLKLDRSFFQELDNQRARTVISSIAELAEKLNIKTVAEGIETEEQMRYLPQIHCDIVQGYYFSKPLPIEVFETWAESFKQMKSVSIKEEKEKSQKNPGGGTELHDNRKVYVLLESNAYGKIGAQFKNIC